MGAIRWFTSLAAASALVGLTACSTGTPPAGGSGGGGTTVTVSVVGSVPWVAAQDGTSTWHTLSGTTFTVTGSSGRYGVAWECAQVSGQPLVSVLQATTSESVAVTSACPAPTSTPGTVSVSGTVYNLPTGGSALVAIGGARTFVTAGSPTYTLNVPTGSYTAFVRAVDSSSHPSTMVVERNVPVSASTTLDFDMSSGTPYSFDTLTMTGVPSGESPTMSASLATSGAPPDMISLYNTTSMPYPVVPSNLAQASDRYLLRAEAGVAVPGVLVVQAVVFVAASPSNGSLQLPSMLSGAGIAVAGGTASATWGTVTFSNGGGLGLRLADILPTSLTSPAWSVVVTGDWLGSATSYTFPDFSATSGWHAAWNVPTGQSGTGTTAAYEANITLPQFQAAGVTPFAPVADYAALPNGTTVELTAGAATGTY